MDKCVRRSNNEEGLETGELRKEADSTDMAEDHKLWNGGQSALEAEWPKEVAGCNHNGIWLEGAAEHC